MSEEKKIVELKDEELEKVSGGFIIPNEQGEYTFTRGDVYRQSTTEAYTEYVEVVVLQSITTSNMSDSVLCLCRSSKCQVREEEVSIFVFAMELIFDKHISYDPYTYFH